MEHRYASSPSEVRGLGTEELRTRFLVPDLFVDDEVTSVYSHYDRVMLLGVKPVAGEVQMPGFPEIRAEHLLERREAGIVNVGGAGTVTVDGEAFQLEHAACLYVGRGARELAFASSDSAGDEGPARFYVFSAPAHTSYPTTLIQPDQGNVLELGDSLTSNRRTIRQYVHEKGVRSCQLVMGVTTLHAGSMWNTMPAHTHDRRMEAYLYFDLPDDARVVHLMGEPDETRHLMVANEQAVISPSWSVHSGVGTASYSFVWAMAGENQSFDDMDFHPVVEMR